MGPVKEIRITAIPQSLMEFHRLTELGNADKVIPSPTKLLVRHTICAADRQCWPMLKDADTLWMVYEKAEEDTDGGTEQFDL